MFKQLRRNLLYLIIIIFFNFVASCNLLEDTKKFHYAIPISLENRTDKNMFVITFPILTSSAEPLEENNVIQVRLDKKSSQFLTYYLGKKVDFEHLVICIIAWQWTSELDFTVFGKKPYIVRTFHNSKFEIGPEKYGIFAEFIIEEKENEASGNK